MAHRASGHSAGHVGTVREPAVTPCEVLVFHVRQRHLGIGSVSRKSLNGQYLNARHTERPHIVLTVEGAPVDFTSGAASM